MSNGLTTEEQKTIAAVFARVPAIERAVLFGSRAMGLARSNSDVDIALYGDKLGLPDILHTASLLEETLLPYHFDLISHASITSPELLEHIRQYGKEMYRKERNPQEKCSSERCIAGNFQEYELSDLCYYADGRAVVSDLDLDTYISTENMLPNKGGIIRSAGLPTVNQTQAYQVNDVLVSNIRPYFRKIWFADREGGCSNDVLVLRAKETCNPKFLYYLLSENAFFDYATATGKGTKMPRGDKKALMCYSVPDMPLKYQVEIAATLSSLDDKIENNRKINQCLEQMAQAIFKAWFVDFEIKKPFTDVVQVLGGGTPKTTSPEYWNGPIPFFTPKDTQEIYVLTTKKTLTEGGLNNCNSRLYPTNTVFVTARGTVGKLAISGIPMAINQSCYALVGNNGYGQYFVYHLALKTVENLRYKASGAVFDAIVTRDFESEIVVAPPIEAVNEFEDRVKPIYEAILSNANESARLVELRDALLPKLLSGEIRVPEAEKMVEETR